MIKSITRFFKMDAVIILSILAIRSVFTISLFKSVNGFTLFGGDSCSRVLMAWKWAKNPTLLPLNQDWLSLPFWIMGLGFKIFPDPVLVPPVINTLFSLGSIYVLFKISRVLFPEDIGVAILTSGVAAFHPFFIWIGLSGLSEPPYYFLVLLGIFFWIKYIKEERGLFLIFASLTFLLSTGFRYEAWFFTFIFSCLILKEIIFRLKKNNLFNWTLFCSMIMAWSFVFYWLVVQKIKFGNPFFFLLHQRNMAAAEPVTIGLTRIDMLKSFLMRSFGFFRLPVLLIAVFGIIRSSKPSRPISDYVVFIVLQFLILTFCYSIGMGGSWIEKVTAITLLLILPLFSHGIFKLIPTHNRNFKTAITCLLISFFILVNIVRYSYDPKLSLTSCQREARKYSRQCAMFVRVLYKTRVLQKDDKILLEDLLEGPDIYEGYFVRIVAPDRIVRDRREKYIFRNRQAYLDTENNPSEFDFPAEVLKDFFTKGNFKAAIAVSKEAKEKLSRIMDRVVTIGMYTIYVRRENRELALKAKRLFTEIKAGWHNGDWINSKFHIVPFWG